MLAYPTCVVVISKENNIKKILPSSEDFPRGKLSLCGKFPLGKLSPVEDSFLKILFPAKDFPL